MSVNKYQPHVLVLPEDDANRQIANGFHQALNVNPLALQVMPPAGGWAKVLDKFEQDHLAGVRKYAQRRIVLLMDFDNDQARYYVAWGRIPEDVRSRVFVLGVLSEPEQLRRKTGKHFEAIGNIVAEDCPDERNELWIDELLEDNTSEVDRFITSVNSFLFGA